MHKQKLLVEYWGIGNVLMNKYHKAKVIDFEKMLVLTLFTPLYDDNYEKPVNNTYALTIEDLANKKRVKQVPVSTLSGDYKIEILMPAILMFSSVMISPYTGECKIRLVMCR